MSWEDISDILSPFLGKSAFRAIVFTVSLISFSSDIPLKNSQNFNNVFFVENYDGDTVKFDIPALHPLLGEKINIRMMGVDTPELRTKDICEKKLAVEAKSFVFKRLKSAKNIDLSSCIRGKYFRLVCKIWVDEIDLGHDLIKNGFAVSYWGGKKEDINWCEKANTR